MEDHQPTIKNIGLRLIFLICNYFIVAFIESFVYLPKGIIMGRHEKLIQKLIKLPKNFTYDELITLMKGFGYVATERGRSSGSAVMFYNAKLNDKIMFHKPHPAKEIKRYILEMVIEKLKTTKML